MQAATVIVHDYVSAIPEWVIEKALDSGALIFDNIDKIQLIKAVNIFAYREHPFFPIVNA